MNLPYWQKNDFKLKAELEWNIPEQKTGVISVIGGNSGSFSSIIRTAEFLNREYPLERVNVLLPDSLSKKVPPLPDISFAPSTDSGSFAKSSILASAVENSDFSLFLGDLSKNSETAIAITNSIATASSDTPMKPVLLTRDTVDLVTPEMNNLIDRENLFFFVSMAQLQKLFRAVYYPKVLLLSMPLMAVIEVLHKFTLSYPCTIVTFHQDQIIVASSGKIITTPLESTNYSPLTLWSGQLASKIAALNLYNPGKPLEATVAAI